MYQKPPKPEINIFTDFLYKHNETMNPSTFWDITVNAITRKLRGSEEVFLDFMSK